MAKFGDAILKYPCGMFAFGKSELITRAWARVKSYGKSISAPNPAGLRHYYRISARSVTAPFGESSQVTLSPVGSDVAPLWAGGF